MIRHVHKYLYNNYMLFNSTPNINGGIRAKRHGGLVYYNILILELSTIFFIDDDKLKLWINIWAFDQQSDIDLDEWWSKPGFIFTSGGRIGIGTSNPSALFYNPSAIDHISVNIDAVDGLINGISHMNGISSRKL